LVDLFLVLPSYLGWNQIQTVSRQSQLIASIVFNFVVAASSCLELALASEQNLSNFSKGFRAFVNGDYELARKNWQESAQSKHAKSMFNLGLLHEQKRISGATYEQAETWFRSAAANGYPAANYYLAQRMFERGGSDDEALALVRAAAGSGYAPAQRYLQNQLNSNPSTAESGSQSSSNIATSSPGFHSENWINQQKPSDWTIQLLAFKERAKVYRFIREHDLQNKAAYFTERSDGQTLYKLVYGAFSSKDQASFARQNLSTALQEYGPWLRPLSSVQAITQR